MKHPNLNGSYLITKANFISSHESEIFLLLQSEENIYGICVNRYVWVNEEESDTPSAAMSSMFADQFEKHGAQFYVPKLHSPVLNGGGGDASSFFYLHTGYGGAKNALECLENVYYLSEIKDFVTSITEDSYPFYTCLVYGRHVLDIDTISLELLAGNWELRTGFHAMTYGPQLDKKMDYIDKLTQSVSTSEKLGRFDFGNLLISMMGMFNEATPSLMSTAVYGYLLNETDLNEEEILKAVRVSIGITETEGDDITAVLEKYTHQELMKMYKRILKGGMEFKLVREFDERREMLTALGLHHFLYDYHVTEVMCGKPSKEKKQRLKTGGRTKDLERQLSSIAEMIRGL